MDNSVVTISVIAIAVSLLSLVVLAHRIVLLYFRLDALITDIIPSTINEEESSTFLVRLVIVNRASVGRTVGGIRLELLKKHRRVDSIEPILPQYELSGHDVISMTDYAMTIHEKATSLGDNVFQPPLDISPGQSTRQWIVLKVSQKYLLQQDDNIQGRLVLLNVRGGQLGQTELALNLLSSQEKVSVGQPHTN